MTSPHTMSDRQLLKACAQKDVDAFGVFYARYRERVLAYFARRVPTPELAADLMAETFAHGLIALQRPSAAIPDTPVGWLLTIAKNQLIDSVRRGKVESAGRRRLGLEPLVLDDHDIERILEVAEAADLLEHAQSQSFTAGVGGVARPRRRRSVLPRYRTAAALLRSRDTQARQPRYRTSQIRDRR